jgi:hypothetical protein
VRVPARWLLALVALLPLAPAAQAAPAVSWDESVTTTRWKQGYLTGSVRFEGQVSEPATLFVFVRRANNRGGVLASKTIELPAAGPFSGRLKLPAQPKPGAYKLRVSLVTPEGNVLLPAARTVRIPAPREGVVARAVVSRARGGKGVVSVRGPVSRMWVRFRFVTPPAPRQRIRVQWFTPDARLLGVVFRTSRFVVDSYIRNRAGAIPKGKWEARLVIGNKIARRTFVRIR